MGQGTEKGLRLHAANLGGERLVVLSWPAATQRERPSMLTGAEWEVAQAAARGLSNAAIAEERRCSARTVGNQLHSVFSKLGIRGRRELARALEGAAGAR